MGRCLLLSVKGSRNPAGDQCNPAYRGYGSEPFNSRYSKNIEGPTEDQNSRGKKDATCRVAAGCNKQSHCVQQVVKGCCVPDIDGVIGFKHGFQTMRAESTKRHACCSEEGCEFI